MKKFGISCEDAQERITRETENQVGNQLTQVDLENGR